MKPSPRTITEVLAGQLAHRYRALERAVTAGVGDPEARFVLGSRPSIAWHTQHLRAAIHSIHEATLTGPQDPSWAEPAPAREDDWSSLRQSTLKAAERLRTGLEALDDNALTAPPLVPVLPAFREHLKTRRNFLEGHVFHVTYHLGSIATLRAEQCLDDR